MQTLTCVEGVGFELDHGLHEPLRRACRDLKTRVRPTLAPLLEEQGGKFTVRGVVGTIELRPGTLLDVTPKTEPEDDWISATLDLLLPSTGVAIAGDRRGELAPPRNPLDVLAAIYAERLGAALRRDGPLLVIERHSDVREVLMGKLDVTRWARHAAWKPHRLPVSYQALTADNSFTRALAHVAELLAHATRDPATSGRLLRLAREVRPGAPPHAAVDPADVQRPLPSQWGAYRGAWDIVVSVLLGKALLGTRGQRHGVSLAVEAWGLLETLLVRVLAHTVRAARDDGRRMIAPAKHSSGLIQPTADSAGKRRRVTPDGRLTEGDATVATFEAKYSRGDGSRPERTHVFQALATAAACRAPLAVLVYPDEFEPVWWDTTSFGDHPRQLVAVGLGLFGYRRGKGDRQRGRRIYELLRAPDGDGGSPSLPVPAP